MKKRILFFLLCVAFLSAGRAFAQDDKVIAYGILLDNTGSLRNQFSAVKNTGVEIAKEVGRRGSTALFTFVTSQSKKETSEIVMSVDWNPDQTALLRYLHSLEIVGGQTTLFDAILASAKNINAKPDISEKVLILITDGDERVSEMKEQEVLNFLKENKIKVYAVGMITELSSKGKPKKILTRITQETGGRVIFPKQKDKPENIVKDLFAENTNQSK